MAQHVDFRNSALVGQRIQTFAHPFQLQRQGVLELSPVIQVSCAILRRMLPNHSTASNHLSELDIQRAKTQNGMTEILSPK